MTRARAISGSVMENPQRRTVDQERASHAADLALLSALVESDRLTDEEAKAFGDMHALLAQGPNRLLTYKQRDWANRVAVRLELDVAQPDPTEQNKKVSRERGAAWGAAEPEVLKNRPLKPPSSNRRNV